jgi:hypothetical protein
MVVRASRPLICRGDESMTDPDLPTRTEDEGATLDLPAQLRGFMPGQVLGERYRVLELLGRGGMGEVWHAFDLKLRVEVALKALREDLSKPPLHTLPHDELLAKLKSLTNLRAVRDPESSTGWKIEVGPFPGWATVPEW